ncbi:MAG: hypothetical protein ACJZ42_05260 [Candidatus Thalassarchaeaceae archaeon]|nr:MAG: hypothetical protein CND84_00870 [Marine Group II euryarchaeote MED-G35]
MPRSTGNPDDESETPPFYDRRKEAESSFWRLKKASDASRENRVKTVLAQEEESLLATLGRVAYISVCILFDGLILTEIPVRMGKTVFSWILFLIILLAAIRIQRQLYDKWLAIDISQIDFDRTR